MSLARDGDHAGDHARCHCDLVGHRSDPRARVVVACQWVDHRGRDYKWMLVGALLAVTVVAVPLLLPAVVSPPRLPRVRPRRCSGLAR